MPDVRRGSTSNFSLYDDPGVPDTTFTPRAARVSLQNDLFVSEETTIVASVFTSSLDGDRWTTTTSGTGTITQGSGELDLRTGTTASSLARLTSTQTPGFLGGNVGHFRAELRIDTTTGANNNRRWGVFDANDGLFFTISSTSITGRTRRATVDTTVSFASTVTNDGNYHTYEIYYSSAEVVWLIDGYVVGAVGRNPAAPYTNNLDLPIRIENDNTGGGTTDNNIFVRGTILGFRGRKPPAGVVSTGNSTLGAALGASGVFTGAWEDVSEYSEITYATNGTPSSAPGTIAFQFSFDGVTVDVTAGNLPVSGIGQVAPHTLVPIARFFRLVYTNGATPLSEFRLQTLYHTTKSLPLTRYASQSFTDLDDVVFTRSILVGKNPAGTYTNIPTAGKSTANSTTTMLGANATFTGTFENVLGYATIGLLVNASHDSASNGVKFQFSDDGVNVIDEELFTYQTINGGQFYTQPVQATYVRVQYINGANAQTSFTLATQYDVTELPPASAPLIDRVPRSTSGLVVRADILPLPSFYTAQVSVPNGSSVLVPRGLAKAKSVSLKAMPSNPTSGNVFIGTSASVTATTGYPLGKGDSVDIELADQTDAGVSVPIYAIADAGGCALAIMEVA